jgi:predicted helicase
MTFKQLLEHYRKEALNERDKGDRFERLMQAYLQTDPQFANHLKHVWLWSEFPGKVDLGGQDTGIDLVALTHEGAYWAIQCKFYKEGSIIDKAAVDSFLSTSARAFLNEQLQTTHFSHRLWIDTTGRKWGSNAEEAIRNQAIPLSRVRLSDLANAPLDWEKLHEGIFGKQALQTSRTLKDHQRQALENTAAHFAGADRGKLIMACGTGKTFTALRIAENQTNGQGLVLFLVPSIALLGQTLREWSSYAVEPLHAICICSDPDISRRRTKNEDSDGFSVVDLALPASTDPEFILAQFRQIKAKQLPGMTVVFSTYQSIEVVARAQKKWMQEGFPAFDLLICDEAHRTTGVTLAGEDESAFVKVHDANFIKAHKRLYMTATPRLYSDDARSRAAQADALLCSMDDESLYGPEMYRIGFGQAVEENLLTDYKVIILTLNDQDVPKAVQRMIATGESEITTDDMSKLIGCVNALSKQFLGDDGSTLAADPQLMRRAVAFCQSIPVSKQIASTYNKAADNYLSELPAERRENMVRIAAQHIDGTMSAPERDQLLSWLKEESDDNECRVITNVKVLSEGVDVPSLDAVLFLSPRNSQVDVVQSVGRVMRLAPGKKYGYIIIPVVVPSDVSPEQALNDNERYKVVWSVLNALRSHDDRFNATVNKIDLNQQRPNQILIGRPPTSFDNEGQPVELSNQGEGQKVMAMANQLAIQFGELQNVVFARLVQKVGDRRYWEQWAKDVAVIAERQIERIQHLLSQKSAQREAFDRFLQGLQQNINPGISEAQAVEMLAQHIITQPIFDALFEGYSFVKNNAVSTAMQGMLEVLETGSNLAADSETLQKFYDSVRKRAEGIDNAEGKQRIIIELYDKFFKTAFPKMVEQLGIVYTPVEVVDFIINSVDDVLQKDFGRSLSDENVHILDPFTGTGTFLTRLLQSGLIKPDDLPRKYQHELHANELVLLAYYIAAVNIENAYHDQLAPGAAYEPFEGIVLTDTFQLAENPGADKLFSEMFPQNSARVERQKMAPLRVIMGNPPYSIGQKSANDNAQNQKYDQLDAAVAQTYAKYSTAGLNKSLYDAYIKAFRWSTDRLDPQHGGVIAFVTNGAWLDGNSTDGFRKVLESEFDKIYVYNLRGNQRTSGELSRKEGGKIFGSGSRTPVAISFLVRKPATERAANGKAEIYYRDIGDYLKREEKLAILKKIGSLKNLPWQVLSPNAEGDWISQRNDSFDGYIEVAPSKKFDPNGQSFFIAQSLGTATNRDSWVYNFSLNALKKNITKTIAHYNEERTLISNGVIYNPRTNSALGNWTRDWQNFLKKNKEIVENPQEYRRALYRPFTKVHCYFEDDLNQERYQLTKIFPENSISNIAIVISSVGSNKGLAVLITDLIPDLHLNGDSQVFPLYYYEPRPKSAPSLFDSADQGDYMRRDGISDFILKRAQQQYGAKNITKEDIFYYVYGFLHAPQYRSTFANDLKKMLPRLPLVEEVKDFWAFSKAGRALAELHVNYEQVPPHPAVQVTGAEANGDAYAHYRVEKMRYPKKGQTDTIVYNSRIVLQNIPAEAYEYVVNGKSAIDWVMERYQITTHKDSGITNDPNDWSAEVGNPRYILDLLLSVINLSVESVRLVKGLPEIKFE